jgi:hypothetical protein
VNSNGNNECGFALDNPEWFIMHDDGLYEQVNSGDGDGRWIYVQLDLDFGAGNFDFFIQDTMIGITESGTRPLLNGVDVDTIELRNYNAAATPNFSATSECYTWYDDIRIS